MNAEQYTDLIKCFVEGNIVATQSTKKRKKKCPLGRKIVGSMFFRSVVYNIDVLLETAKDVLRIRKNDLYEFTHYVDQGDIEDDEDYRQELAREIVFWNKMIALYKFVQKNQSLWYKKGKFRWSGSKISTPYFDSPLAIMEAIMPDKTENKDSDMTPVAN